jgi:hypothetical protein
MVLRTVALRLFIAQIHLRASVIPILQVVQESDVDPNMMYYKYVI